MTSQPHRLRDFARAQRGSGTTYMLVGTVVAAIAAYLFQLVAGRALGPTAFAPITVLWTIQFLVFTTVFMPMEQLTIRRLNVTRATATPWALFLSVIAAAMVASLLFTVLTLDRLFAGERAYLPIVVVLIAGYGGFALGRGYLAGRQRYREYGLSTLAESVLRLLLAVALLAVGIEALGLAWSLVAGAFVVWLWRPLRGERLRAPAGQERDRSGRALAAFIGANGSSQTILAAGPLVVGALGAPAAEVSKFFETFLLFRAPLTVAYNLVSRVLPPFTRLVDQGEHATLRRWAIRLGALALIGSVAGYAFGYAVGPQAVAVLLGDEFRPDATLAALAASGMAIATVALFSQQMLIALRATGRLAVAWGVALAVAALTLMVWTGGGDSIRVARGFLAGEVVAMVGIVLMVMVAAGRPAAPSGPRTR